MVSRALSLALRGFQAFCILLVMALIGNMIASANRSNPAIINFDMFVAVWGMLSLFYLIPATLNENFEFHPAIKLALDVTNLIWFFIGAVATAAYLGVHSCTDRDYLKSNFITSGANDMTKRCREGQASDAFLFFGFFAFLATTVVTLLQSRGRVNMRGPGSSPSMSQV